jgi:hypothetical protein
MTIGEIREGGKGKKERRLRDEDMNEIIFFFRETKSGHALKSYCKMTGYGLCNR